MTKMDMLLVEDGKRYGHGCNDSQFVISVSSLHFFVADFYMMSEKDGGWTCI